MNANEDPIGQYIVLIGNPGVGKSTILNGLVEKVQFKSGFSPGKGLTSTFQLYKHVDNITYGDTPGLSDIEMRKQAAESITKVLQRNGLFRLIFVVTVEAGRVRPDDVTTINLVLDSIQHKVHYGVIVNKVGSAFVKNVSGNKEMKEKIFGGFNTGNHKTDYFYYFTRCDELDDQNDVLHQLPQDLRDFIYKTVPENIIMKEQVKEIAADQFKAMQDSFAKQMTEMENNAKKREEAFLATIKQLEEDKNNIFKNQQKQAELFEKRFQEQLSNNSQLMSKMIEIASRPPVVVESGPCTIF